MLSDLFVPACQVSAKQEDSILLGEVLAKFEVAAVRWPKGFFGDCWQVGQLPDRDRFPHLARQGLKVQSDQGRRVAPAGQVGQSTSATWQIFFHTDAGQQLSPSPQPEIF